MFTLRHLLISGLIATLFFCGSCSDLSREETARVEEALRDTLVSTTESWGMTLNIIDDGHKKLRLKGKHATTISRSDTQMTRIQGPVDIQVIDSSGTVTTRVRSNRAIYYSREALFDLYGEVFVTTHQNRKLRSEYLRWNQKENNVNTPRYVTITTPQDSIAGHGFTGTADLTDYSIRKVSGDVTIEQESDSTQ